MAKLKAVILTLVIAAIGLYFGYDYSINSPVDATNNTQKVFEIKKGESLKSIAGKLKENSFIHNETAFHLYSRYHGLDKDFIAGRFTLSQSMTVPEIIEVLTNATQGNLVITIQEGHTAKDIDDQLTILGLIKPNEFINSVNKFNNYKNFDFLPPADPSLPIKLEGYLFPDTYFLSPSTYNNEEFLELLLTTFKQKAFPSIEKDKSTNHSIKDIIIMASIIELEASGTEDAPIISGILWKRLDNNWFLGADATSLYLKDTNTITATTLQEQSEYNTRKFRKGLPPGPISNPGLTSIIAALNPIDTEYWYYLHAPDGNTHYAKTDTQHNTNRARYLQ